MAFLGLFNKNDKTLESDIIKNIAKNINVENAIITYLLLQAKANSISLAKKNDRTYICFCNKEINDFLNEWYTLLQMHQKKKLSDKMYDIYINNQLEENKLTDENKTSELSDDFD
jgi:hypothetical protein